ncbi:aspartyl protease family protein [Gillisia sp. M10.2A]|uniref:Aspartyl protease family protein n=1 Tax=Gillisia lutea TaxID=2909668 RepID=A0ABS9EI09_9FLAO|nr:aspartyl protease family protein [Gillisia lutea]MCF4102433.1 aspartyl protease family protein [Gillisia lutea]
MRYFFWSFFFCALLPFSLAAQDDFNISDNKDYFDLKFELVNDLVVIPVGINGVELSFLLDTGVDSTVLFSLQEKDSLEIKNATVIYLRGLGEGEPVRALKSTGNVAEIGSAFHSNLTFYVVYEHEISLSNRIGVPIHGILGYDFFKDFVVEFNYTKKRLRAYKNDKYNYKSCARCEDFKLTFHKNKPYIDVIAGLDGTNEFIVSLLIDSGSGDALWLFQDPKSGVVVPETYFEDFLGYGMGGSVYGLRSRIPSFKLGKFKFKEVTASFPDTLYFSGIDTYNKRNGTIGAQILKRFHSTFDYKNERLRLKPNKYFKDPFEYDMSGIVLAHDGYTVVKDIENYIPQGDPNETHGGVIAFKSEVDIKYVLEPEYKIVEIRPGSPAEIEGLMIDDVVLEINGRPTYKFSLEQINKIFSAAQGKRVKLRIRRKGVEKVVSFKLEKIL